MRCYFVWTALADAAAYLLNRQFKTIMIGMLCYAEPNPLPDTVMLSNVLSIEAARKRRATIQGLLKLKTSYDRHLNRMDWDGIRWAEWRE